jgi:AAA+ superfamily predicted ATPase
MKRSSEDTNRELPPGLLDVRTLPDTQFDRTWESIILDPDLKEQLFCQAILSLTLRQKVARDVVPLHGVILLVGRPGTGKTSLARGLASKVATIINGTALTFLEVEPHSLTSSAMGKTQRAVTELLGSTVAEFASQGPVVVLLDEVETMAIDRKKLSMDANPVDIHRATDAVLAQLDHLAERFPNLLFIATSNFETAVDEAFVSRADLVLNVPLPNAEARRAILEDTFNGLAETYVPVKKILKSPDFQKAVEMSDGLDGRRLRKLVVSACSFRKETALDPGKMTAADLLRAVKNETSTTRQSRGKGA